jgi:SAM-dependent methyltransferase
MTCLAPATFPHERLQMIAERERTRSHFWHAPRHRLLLDEIARLELPEGARVLDVGCGTGAMVEALAQCGLAAHGLDPWAATRGLDAARFRTGQVESIPWPDGDFDALCAFDVLEHADDGPALEELWRVLRPGGRLFVSVPAYDWLWSTRDTLAGHRRRYTRASLRACVGAAGFDIERVFGFQCLLLPLFAASRLWARVRGHADTGAEDTPGRVANAALRTVNSLEVGVGRVARPPAGSSLLLVARKPAGTNA